ncbi:translocation/assembly module TamB domain-containing protein [Chitinolyticbacter meiyuanensis]|uniref:translocation/assembly module TamB domain-containing protein n=1 Tax=Chitinolyticbacter meiyuanensis TaxID=682798 RepID=UPI001652699A|nr:translocation/assembly module TamB domain-containing protein [Chitinolyticbacter meiyuanensis]
MSEIEHDPATPPVPEPLAKLARLRRRWPWLVLLAILLLLAGGTYGALRWLDSPSGHGWLVDRVNGTGVIKLGAVSGSLWQDLVVSDLIVDTESVHVAINRIRLVWNPQALWRGRIAVSLLDVGAVDLTSKPQPPDKPKTPPPEQLTLPLGVRVNEFRLARLRVAGTPVDLKALRASLDSDGNVHKLELAQLLTPRGRAQASLQLDGRAPFATAGRLRFAGKIDDYVVDTDFALTGQLRNLGVAGHVGGDKLKADVKLRLDAFAPYAYAILLEADLAAEHVDPAALQPGLPRADLAVRLTLDPTSKGAAGTLAVTNAAPGRLDESRLPFSRLDGEFAAGEDWLTLNRLQLALPGRATLAARGQFTRDKLQAQLTLAGVDLQALQQGLIPTELGGTVTLNGGYRAPDIVLALTEARLKTAAKARLGWINPEHERRIAVQSLELARGNSRLQAHGEFGFERQDFKIEALAQRWNPADYAAVARGDISGKLALEGAAKPALAVKLDYTLQPSSFNGYPLAGAGKLALTGEQLHGADFWLSLGDNRVAAKGALGRPNDTLTVELAIKELQQAGRGYHGRVLGKVLARGDWRKPRLQADLDADDLQTPFGLEVGQAQVDADLYPDLNSPFKLQARVRDAKGFGGRIATLSAELNGTRARHQFAFDAQGGYGEQPLALALQADGGFDASWLWSGRVNRLQGEGPLPVRLLEPVQARLGAHKVELGSTALSVGRSQLRLGKLVWRDGSLQTRGNASTLDLAEWLALTKPQAGVSTDLVMSAQWDVTLDRLLNGRVALQRVSGDVRRQVGRGTQSLELDQLQAVLTARDSGVSIDAQVASKRFGHLSLNGASRLDAANWRLAPGADLDVRVNGELPDLARIAPLLSDSLALQGGLKLDVRRRGPLAAPSFTGTLSGTALGVHDKATGIRLRDGELNIALSERKVLLQTFRFKGGSGTLTASGAVDLSRDETAAEATVNADHLLLVNRPDLALVVSGKGDIRYGVAGLSVTGNLRADRGRIEYRGNDVPTLSDDVVVVGRERESAGGKLKVADVSFDVDLGEDFTFRGYGLEALLTGKLRFRASPEAALSARGVVQVDEGTYRAYGQKLDIERGILSFAGPIDNPALDILAVRRGGAVEAGVQVKGNAMSPQVTLYSDPVVSDNEKLAWLLFGHGGDNMDKGDAAVMVQALNAILTEGNPGEGFTDQIFESLGIDEVGFSSAERTDGTTSQVVTVSKRVGRWLRVGLEKSFDGLSDAVSMTVLLSRRWSFVTRFGTDESEADVLYSISFD